MKYLLYTISVSLYFFGDVLSRFFCKWDSLSFLYPVYNHCMTMSSQLDEENNLGVWTRYE